MLLAILLVSGLIYLRFRQANAVVNQGLALLDEPAQDSEDSYRTTGTQVTNPPVD